MRTILYIREDFSKEVIFDHVLKGNEVLCRYLRKRVLG